MDKLTRALNDLVALLGEGETHKFLLETIVELEDIAMDSIRDDIIQEKADEGLEAMAEANDMTVEGYMEEMGLR